MKFILPFLLSFSISLISFSQTYITNVTLVDVEQQKLIPAQTVTIKGELISAIESSGKIKIPANVAIIDGSGKFLMPGLTDAHVHFFQSGGLYTRPDVKDLRKYMPYEKEMAWTHDNMEDLLKRYLREGITTVIDPGATFNFLQQRDSFANKPYSPAIFMSGPLVTTYEPEVYKNLNNDEPFNFVTNADEAQTAVQKQLPFHPDFIKIWYIIDYSEKSVEISARKLLPIVKATIDEAHKNHLRVAVHATERITAQLAVESGCDYLVHGIADEIVSEDFISLLKKNNIILCPTLNVSDGYFNSFSQNNNITTYDLNHSNPEPLGSLQGWQYLSDTAMVNNTIRRSSGNASYYMHSDSIKMANLEKMTNAGVTIATGTDAGNIGTLHATSYFKELNTMSKSGLSNWQIILASTINGAKVLGKEKEFGSIATGKKANLVLLDANPVDDLENLKKINLVFNKGMVFDPDTLLHESPLQIVQHQFNAYNEKNIDAFLEPYSIETEMYTLPDMVLLTNSKDEMRKIYGNLFKKYPNLHCEIKNRIIQGNMVIEKEYITGTCATPHEGTAIYYIEGGKIRKVYFVK